MSRTFFEASSMLVDQLPMIMYVGHSRTSPDGPQFVQGFKKERLHSQPFTVMIMPPMLVFTPVL